MRLHNEDVLVIGLGRFGSSLALELMADGVEVLGIDASDKDDEIAVDTHPVKGMYMPDGAISYTAPAGGEYVVTANEGDAREYDCFAEEERVKDLDLDPTAFPDADSRSTNR